MSAAAPGTVLVFLNEVAGGRKLLEAVRERVAAGTTRVALAAPQNQPGTGQIVDRDELEEAARARVEVTRAIFSEYGIESEGAVFDRDSMLALDDAVRAFKPDEILISALGETRLGLMRRDLVMAATERFEVPVTHIPVRIEDDAVRWDLTHTLVVATRTVSSDDLIAKLRALCAERPHRFTFVCPRSGDIGQTEVAGRLARTLAALYRDGIDATGQPMSPEPLPAVKNAIEHYRIDDILISTLAGQRSLWLADGLIENVKKITNKPIEHFEAEGEGTGVEVDQVQPAIGAAR